MPLLFAFIVQILKELEMVMKSNEIESTCQENWAKWCPAIIDYAEANSHPTNALQQALRDLPTTMTPYLHSW